MKELEPKYLAALDRIIDDCFNLAWDKGWTWQEFAEKAGLSYNTVYNLGMKETRLPQLRTIVLLAQAAGSKVLIKRIKSLSKGASHGVHTNNRQGQKA